MKRKKGETAERHREVTDAICARYQIGPKHWEALNALGRNLSSMFLFCEMSCNNGRDKEFVKANIEALNSTIFQLSIVAYGPSGMDAIEEIIDESNKMIFELFLEDQ